MKPLRSCPVLPAAGGPPVKSLHGELYCRDMSLFLLEPNPLFDVVQWPIMGGWVLFAMVLFAPVLSVACRGWWMPALTVLVVIGIIVGTTLPGTLKNELRQEIIQEAKTYSHTLTGTDETSGVKLYPASPASVHQLLI